MKTLMGTPEIEWRRIFGVIWDKDEDQPLTEYTDFEEAARVAAAAGGYIVEKWFGFTDWSPVEFA